jgi:hypothetical protein
MGQAIDEQTSEQERAHSRREGAVPGVRSRTEWIRRMSRVDAAQRGREVNASDALIYYDR